MTCICLDPRYMALAEIVEVMWIMNLHVPFALKLVSVELAAFGFTLPTFNFVFFV